MVIYRDSYSTVPWGPYLSNSLEYIYPGVKLLGRMVTLCLTHWGIVKLFHFTFPPAVLKSSNISTSSIVFFFPFLKFVLHLLQWHSLIKLYSFQVYNSMIHHLYIAVCAHNPKPNITILVGVKVIWLCLLVSFLDKDPRWPEWSVSSPILGGKVYCCCCFFFFTLKLTEGVIIIISILCVGTMLYYKESLSS